MSQVQFGWTMPAILPGAMAGNTYVSNVQRGLELVAGHFDSAWIVDHLQNNGDYQLEAWTAMTYMAALQPQLKFGHVVLCQSFRNPALLAKMASTFQYMSGGRFILGIGAGWKEDEYIAYGYHFPPAGTRVEELKEAVQIIKAMWHDIQVTLCN